MTGVTRDLVSAARCIRTTAFTDNGPGRFVRALQLGAKNNFLDAVCGTYSAARAALACKFPRSNSLRGGGVASEGGRVLITR